MTDLYFFTLLMNEWFGVALKRTYGDAECVDKFLKNLILTNRDETVH